MNPILIDTDILIEVSRQRDASILTRWKEVAESGAVLLCSPVTIAEMWHGARPKDHETFDALFSALMPVPIDFEIGRLAGTYLHRYHASHHVELGDALIAATAVAHGAALWTRNRKHFPMPELALA